MDNLKDFESANGNGNKKYVVIIAIETILLAVMCVLYFTKQHTTTVQQVQIVTVSAEKDSLAAQYQNLLADYENIETTNDSISAQLEQQKEHIRELMTELKTTKSENKAQIAKMKKELKTLRDVMKNFVHQIDSLNTLNIQLTEENTEVKKQITAAKKENKQLTQKYEESQAKVAKASVIKAINSSMTSFNAKGKPANKAKKIKRLAVSFTLDENPIAPRGNKKVYVRITSPDGLMLINKEQDTFKFEDDKITFSALRQVDYKGEKIDMVIYYECEEGELKTGVYKTDIFCDGNMIGTTEIELK
ncbi:MAG: hypothetical protein IKW86_05375 [Salinivirgaceae bacterium]|nr:hypothetical protein [Salinivirgaceae bacterium]